MARNDELRLIARVARMYYEWQMRQSEIAEQLGLSQATVSRLLSRAQNEGIIRISVNIPEGIHTTLEETLIQKFGLRDAIVVDSISYDDEKIIQKEVGSAAAYYLENVLRQNEVVGLSSWSATLIALVDAMHVVPRRSNVRVVQILGGIGTASAQVQASHLASRLANLVNGDVVFLPVPGVVGSEAALNVLLDDENVRSVFLLFPQVTTALVGIGAIEPSNLLAASGNIFTEKELAALREHGAVGDILLRFFNEQGAPMEGFLTSRVISMTLEQLRKVERAIGVAGGRRKYAAIRGALYGKLVNILITDHFTAERLCRE
ncbi:MAG TPA: sugar-binding transcriptional regulator [Anaerolineaceae bacterium]|nr:sugar-binding transcriptional regulator [Anaerolineaceae bacterium]